MSARVFRTLPKVTMRVFREPGAHYWQRWDAADPAPIRLIFTREFLPVDTEAFESLTGKPVAHVLIEDALAIAPGRAADIDTLFSNRDHLTIAGVRYRVESCTPDGLASVIVELTKAA